MNGTTISETSALESFVRAYADRKYIHTALVRHKGRVVAFAMDESYRFWYAVLDTEPEDDKTANGHHEALLDVAGWPDRPQKLGFPREIAEVGYSVADPLVIPPHKKGTFTPERLGTNLPIAGSDEASTYDYFLSTTARLSAPTPFQVVSDGTHLYLFRQALGEPPPEEGQIGDPIDTMRHMVYVDAERNAVVHGDDIAKGPGFVDADGNWVSTKSATPIVSGTLLVDRFVLAGHELLTKREVRYQRSRHRTRPASRTDSLGAADLDGSPFYEPTLELRFLGGVHVGRFSVLLVPTETAGVKRWQFFVHSSRTGRIDALNVERSVDGLFNTMGSTAYTCEVHHDVFSPVQGTCTRPVGSNDGPCGRNLVPQVTVRGCGASAVHFESTTRVSIDPPVPVGAQFSVEAWLRSTEPAKGKAWRLVLDGGKRGPEAGLSMWISSSGRVRIGFGDGSAWYQHETKPIVARNRWQHLAVTSNGTTWRFVVDGTEREKTTRVVSSTGIGQKTAPIRIKGIRPIEGSGIRALGSSRGGFNGDVDEVRVWNWPRSLPRLQEERHHRLTGLEPGLDAYWCFDEAEGEIAFDQTDNGHNGSIRKGEWVCSDAPIGEPNGLSRSAFEFSGRRIASGPATVLYYRQSKMPCGYERQPAAFKHECRVMFAVATLPVGGDPADVEPYVAALDIGVSASGRLAQVPKVFDLADIEPEKAAEGMERGEVTMPLVHLDGSGLSTTGGLLRFAWTPNTPFLFDSATGNVVLYYRGIDDQFFAAYYTSAADSPTRTAPDGTGTPLVLFVAQATGAELADLDVTISGRAKETCAVRIQGAGITEEWKHLPRAPERLVAIINGLVPDTAVSDADNAYDYAAHSTTTMPSSNLRLGSLLVRGMAVGNDPLPVGKHTATPPADSVRSCHWTAAAPGLALRFDEDANAATAAPEIATEATRSDDLTMEAWVRPPADVKDCSIIDQASNGSGYGLSLVERRVDAMFLDGFRWIRIPDSPALDVEGDITLEAWVRPLGLGGIRTIVGRRSRDGATAAVFMRIHDGTCEAGSYETAAGSATVAYELSGTETDGQWLHFAAVWHDHVWRLYRNGEEVDATPDTPIGGLRLNGPWLIGSNGFGTEAGYVGEIDDLRIWSRARSESEIRRDMMRRLSGTEDGLAGYWRLSAGELTDRTRHDNDGILEGAPTAGGFDGKSSHVLIPQCEELNFSGELTLEAWIRPTAHNGLRNILAHGYTRSPDGEVYLRINENGTYQVGSWQGSKRSYYAVGGSAIDDVKHSRWVHLAATYYKGFWYLLRNGEIIAAGPGAQGAIPVASNWAIGARGTGTERFFAGGIGDVRVWNYARSREQIRTWAPRRLFGDEEGLVGYWPLGEHGGRDLSPTGAHGEVHDVPSGGPLSGAPSPIPAYGVVAHVADTCHHSHGVISPDEWAHVGAIYKQSSALTFDGDTHLDCGNNTSLDIRDDLTIEIDVQLADLDDYHGLVSKGEPSTEEDQHVPYSVSVDQAGRIGLAFEDGGGKTHSFWSGPGVITAGEPKRLAITRCRQDDFGDGGSTIWHDVCFYGDGKLLAKRRWVEQDDGIEGTNQPLRIGKAYVGSRAVSLRGELSQVRLWNTALEEAQLGRRLTGREKGLVSWWPIDERKGTTTLDRKSTNHARVRGTIDWGNDPDTANSKLMVFLDGRKTATEEGTVPAPYGAGDRLTLGPAGALDEVRIWRSCRTVEQIQDSLFGRLTGGDQNDLIAYYTFDRDDEGRILDQSLSACHLDGQDAKHEPSTAPVGDDTPLARSAILGVRNNFNGLVDEAPEVGEYGDLQLDDAGILNGVLKRCYSYVRDGRWHLVTGFKVGDLRTTWIGQVQFAPQLKGYIEGAPPVPGENLIPGKDYDDASTVELEQAERVERTYSSERSAGFDQHTEFLIGTMGGSKTEVGFLGFSQRALDLKSMAGVKGVFDVSLSQLSSAASGSSLETKRQTRLGLRGRFETGVGKPAQRFVAENTGLALVESETADVFALRLFGNDALVGLEMRPNPDIPKDWNLIHFPIDPRYTKQGTLDGRRGVNTDEDYPNAMKPSSDASYFKPIEGYALKRRIRDDEERERVTYQRFQTAARAAGTRLPDVHKRNIINTYVWTADGGFFAETEEKTDTRHELVGGSYEFKGMGGLSTELEFGVFGVGITFKLDALFGGHLNQLVSKAHDESHLFAVAVDLGDVEHDIYGSASPGAPAKKLEGKVDAYRFMTFYLDPNSNWHDEFFGRVVDPIWLSGQGPEGDTPAAAALRQARQDGKSPACWRVLHRVTYVSRILPDFKGDKPKTFEERLRSLEIESNYELIRQLEPYVAGYLDDPVAFREAVERILAERLPELVGDADRIVTYMGRYLGVQEVGL